MRTQTSIQNNRAWVGITTQLMLIVCAMGVIAYGYHTMLATVADKGPVLSHVIAVATISLCLTPGVALWQYLRPTSKYAALYGLLVSAAACWVVPLLVG